MCTPAVHRKGGCRDHMRHQNALWQIRWLMKPSYQFFLLLACMVLLARFYKVRVVFDVDAPADAKACSETPTVSGTVLVSYSYFQKDDVQKKNFEFFIAIGMGVSSGFKPPNYTDFVLVINGAVCDPCTALLPYMDVDSRYKNLPDVEMAWSSADVAVLQRRENEGMDFAAHNVRTMSSLQPVPVRPSSTQCKPCFEAACKTESSHPHAGHHRMAALDGAVAQVQALHPAQQLSQGAILPIIHGDKLAMDTSLHRPPGG